jgi:serine/threonine protein kinase
MSAEQDNLIGRMIDGRYLVETSIGVGGMGGVYLARDLKVLGRTVVVKALLKEAFQNEYVVKKFRQEAEALSRLDHPNIVGILDVGELEGSQPYLVLQFIDGVTLRSIMQPGGIELLRAAKLIRQVAYALAAAHDRGILHRDLKPENIMLQVRDGEERAVVIDFGIAQLQDSVIAPKTIITATAGTIAYMSPEQLSAAPLSTASDVYALGIVAYEMVTGVKPFNPKSPFQLLEMQRDGIKVLPGAIRPDLPEAAQNVILKALAFEPENRFSSIKDFGNELGSAIFGTVHGYTIGEVRSIHASSPPQTGQQHAVQNISAPPPGNGIVPDAIATQLYDSEAPEAVEPVRSMAETPAEVQPHSTQRSLKIPAIILLLIVLIAGGGFGVWRWKKSARQTADKQATGIQTSAPQQKAVATQSADAQTHVTENPAPAQPAPAGLELGFSLTVQRVRDGKEYKEPFESTGREIFENGWRFRMNVSAPRAGYLYILNEGLNDRGAKAYTVLFPTDNNAHIEPKQVIQIPKQPRYFFFTGEAGTEKIWLIWSEKPVAEMEALKGLVNPRNQGEVSNVAQADSVRTFLASHQDASAEIERDTVNKRTNIKGKGDLLVYLTELEHQ